MEKLRTWKEIKSFDDIILKEEREIILELKKKSKLKCPHLQIEGEFFHYCGLNLPKQKDRKPAQSNPIYQRNVSLVEMQLYCGSSFEGCCFYSNKLKR